MCDEQASQAPTHLVTTAHLPTEPMKKPIISYASVVLKCEPHVPGVPIRWYLNDEDLQPGTWRRLSSDNQTLILNPVSLWDAGDFQCAEFNPASSFRSARIRLKVTVSA